MKLVRFSTTGKKGGAKLGVLVAKGVIDSHAAWLAYCETAGHKWPEPPGSIHALLEQGEKALERVGAVADWVVNACSTTNHLLLSFSQVRLLAPLSRPPKIICIGMNYRDHCVELGQKLPRTPIVFGKFGTAVAGPDDEIIRPRITSQLDYEAELGVVIGRGGRNIVESHAMDHVAGYLNFNDVSARDLQFSDGQWVRAKTADTFAPMGPALVTREEIADPHSLAIRCRVNGTTMQESNTREMIFSIPFIISFLSQFMSLEAGDVVATGTPPGVGFYRKPPVFLQPGDTVEVEIEGLGTLRNRVQDEK